MYIFLSSLLALGIFLLYLHCFLYLGKKKTLDSPTLPPGNFGWPIIGESLDFVSTLHKGCPEKFVIDRMNKFSPTQVVKTSLIREKMVLISEPLANKLLFANDGKLVIAWWPTSIKQIFFPGRSIKPITDKIRTIVLEFLKPEALPGYLSLIQDTIEDHLDKHWLPKNELKVHPLSKKLMFSIINRLSVGLENGPEIDILNDLFSVITEGLISIPINFPGTRYYRGVKASIEIRKHIIPIIEKKRSQNLSKEKNLETSTDLISMLVLQRDENGNFLSDMDIADQILGVIFASHGSTSSLITAIIYYLADNPMVYARVLEEQTKISKSKAPEERLTREDIQQMKYSRHVINETLRIATPIPGVFREVLTDFSFGGCIIPKGWKIYLSAHAMHKNEKFFPSPDIFDPSRFEEKGPAPYTFVPWGGGPALCPGAEFARLETLVFMYCLVTKVQWQKIIPDEKMIFNHEAVPENGLPIRLSLFNSN